MGVGYKWNPTCLGIKFETLVLGEFGCHSSRSKHMGVEYKWNSTHLGANSQIPVMSKFNFHPFGSKHMGVGCKWNSTHTSVLTLNPGIRVDSILIYL